MKLKHRERNTESFNCTLKLFFLNRQYRSEFILLIIKIINNILLIIKIINNILRRKIEK